MYRDTASFCANPTDTLQDSIAKMNENRMGIILVVDGEKRLIGTVTDGDIRRAVLARIDLSSQIQKILVDKSNTKYAKPLVAYEGEDKSVYLKLLRDSHFSHLPILNKADEVVGLVAADEFIMENCESLDAMVMAGGRGTRLHPLTEDTPKPMLPVKDTPLLEIIINQLKMAGIKNVNVTTHHQPEKIKDHFGDGRSFGVNVSYVSEEQPLGTVGALGLIKKPEKTMLVMNGDILTQVDFRAMLQFHREYKADLTVGVRVYSIEVPYGVVECDDVIVKRLKEKPHQHFLVNAGIYFLEPHVHEYVPSNEFFNMTDLIQTLMDHNKRVISFPIHEYWLDVGELAEYKKAQEASWVTKS